MGAECDICRKKGGIMVRPCKCSNAFHRDCLDKRRIYAKSAQDFHTCPSCHEEYRVVPVPSPAIAACGAMCKINCLYRLTVLRDLLTGIVLIGAVFGLMGVVLYKADDHIVTEKVVPKVMQGKACMFADDWDGMTYVEGEEIPGEMPCYAVGGVAVFFILVSCCMCCYQLFDKCCGGDDGCACSNGCCNESSACNAVYCCWWGDPCYTSHYYGGGSDGCCVCCFVNDDCLGKDDCCCAGCCEGGGGVSDCNCCDCSDCNGCDCTDLCTSTTKCDCDDRGGGGGGEGLIVLILVALAIMILVGFFVTIYMVIIIGSAVFARHTQIARNRLLAKQEFILDKDASDILPGVFGIGGGAETPYGNGNANKVTSNPVFDQPTGEGFVVQTAPAYVN